MNGNHVTQRDIVRPFEQAHEKIEQHEASFKSGIVADFSTRNARDYPDRIAIEMIDGGARASYAEVDSESNRIALALRALGVRPGDRVAVMLGNRLVFPLIWFAIAKLGAVIVPLNMRYTPREIEYVISDAGCSFAIVDGTVLQTFRSMQPWPAGLPEEHVMVVAGEADGRAKDFAAFASSYTTATVTGASVSPDSLMNIQYTSGTTGFPKGCMLTHEYWMTFAHQAACWEAATPRRLMTAQPFFYADPQWHLLKSFGCAGTFFMAPRMSSTRFVGWLEQHSIEWCQMPELVARQEQPSADASPALKSVVAFGWSQETCRRFRRLFGVPTRDAFAMTEIGFGTQMPSHFSDFYDSGSVGVRAPLRAIKIVKDDGSEACAGEIGELWVRGQGLFKGYWNKPEATAAAFVDGWFRTGDLFRSDERGLNWLVGRVKDMIRRSSENIAAREVEAVLRELTEIEDVAAVPVKDHDRGEEVKIYVQLKSGVSPEHVPVERILQHARSRLAVFKVPRYISYIDDFPRTASNKIVKRDLIAATTDLRLGAYDAQEKMWR